LRIREQPAGKQGLLGVLRQQQLGATVRQPLADSAMPLLFPLQPSCHVIDR
jgi:hypothetical protein